jgi:hypothetical protein
MVFDIGKLVLKSIAIVLNGLDRIGWETKNTEGFLLDFLFHH